MRRSAILLLILYGAALFAGFLAPYSPSDEFREYFFHPPSKVHLQNSNGEWTWPYVHPTLLDEGKHVFVEATPQACRLALFTKGCDYKFLGIMRTNIHLFGVQEPAKFFLMGTDQSGRDIFSRILYGARISLTAGFIGVLLTTIAGWWIGGVAGYYGGKIDSFIMRFADVVMVIPTLYLILAVRNLFPLHVASEVSYTLILIVLSSTGWAGLSRIVRGIVLSLREEQFILAARAQGASLAHIFFRHVVPNTAPVIIVRATLLIPTYILAEVTLSFLGVGIQEPTPSWGNMLSVAQDLRVLTDFPWTLAPGAFLLLTVLGFNFFAEEVRRKLSRGIKT